MSHYEYKVVPAPTKGTKTRGVKTPEGRFANSLEAVLNAQGGEGWEYLRAELLPSDERSGLTGSTTNWRNVLVFRRQLQQLAGSEPVRLVEIVERSVAEEAGQPGEAVPVAARETGTETPPEGDALKERIKVSGLATALRARRDHEAGQSAPDPASGGGAKG